MDPRIDPQAHAQRPDLCKHRERRRAPPDSIEIGEVTFKKAKRISKGACHFHRPGRWRQHTANGPIFLTPAGNAVYHLATFQVQHRNDAHWPSLPFGETSVCVGSLMTTGQESASVR